jgi:acyl carrier protein
MIDDSQIKDCLIELRFVGKDDILDPNDSLFDRGIIDSLGITALVSLLTSRYGIVVPDEDLLPDHFDSMSSIARYVNNKLGSVSRKRS